jgi:apolipoprotein N-acyltransferase
VKPRVFLPAVASGALLWAAFFPLDLGPLGFAALVPWLTLVRAPVSNRRRYFAAYLGGVTFFALATNWVRVAHPMMVMSWVGLAAVMPIFWLAALAIVRRLDRFRVPLAVSAPVGWVALEYFRMHFPTGFPFMKAVGAYQMIGFGWYFLGYTQHAFAQLIQIADLGGVYAVSFVVASVNGALAALVLRAPAAWRLLRWDNPTPQSHSTRVEGEQDPRYAPPAFTPSLQGRGWGAGLVFSLGLLAASVGYGVVRLGHAPFAQGPVVSAIQGSVGQDDKMGDPQGLLHSYSRLHEAAFHQTPVPPDLIVWPETCCPLDWFDIAPGAGPHGMPEGYGRALAHAHDELLGRAWNTYVLFGLNGLEWDGERVWRYNSAFAIRPLPRDPMWKPGDPALARSAAVGRYDKMHLVPFGEYVPLGEVLPFMQWFTPYKKGYECRPGEHWTRFPITARGGRDYTFGCLICYEDSDPYLARQYVATEPVNFLVNISNDGWFKGTEEHEQHLAICRFRAVEARRSVVRSVNMGISAVIDPDGAVAALPRLATRQYDAATGDYRMTLSDRQQRGWTESKKVEGIVTAAVPIDDRAPPYAQLGDWIPAACWAVAGVALAAGVVRRRSAGTADRTE